MSTANPPTGDAYETLSLIFDFPDNEQRLWWHSTGPIFAALLKTAGYHVHDQYRHLGIFKKHIIPSLGVFQVEGKPRWQSILTRYGIPLELSLNLTNSVVRYTYEPIHEATGTEEDPYNAFAFSENFQKLVQLQPGSDLEWFNYFNNELVLNRTESANLQRNGLAAQQIRTQRLLALDLKGKQFALKAYYYPHLKSVATGVSTHDLIFRSVHKLSQKHIGIQPALQVLNDYIASRNDSVEAAGAECSAIHARIFSCDLVDPAKSRIKMYWLVKTVSLSEMEDLWTMGGRRNDPSTMEGLDMVRELWDLLDIPSGFVEYPTSDLHLGAIPDEQLSSMVNYTLHNGNPMPEPQLYFAVFGMNDLKVISALTEFLHRHGCENMASKYRGFLEES
ncbi:hypothetical protein E4U55_004632 [Claviceps digitariae]|nr:hypothetical protein E4U55_004632 [Claviceps digitariae]